MGVDRQPWSCQRGVSKRAGTSAEKETSGISPRRTSSHPTTPDTSNCFGNGLGEGRNESSGGVDAGGTRRRPWLNHAPYNLEVTRSPSYLRGAAGLTLPPSPAAAQTPKAAAVCSPSPTAVCSPSPTAVMKSPPAPVRTGRPTKPIRRVAGGATKALSSGGGGGAGAGGGSSGQGQHLLPPPAIQREASSSFFKSGSTGGVMSKRWLSSAPRPRCREHGEEDRGLEEAAPSFGRIGSRNDDGGGGGGGGGGGNTPCTLGTREENPSTPGVEKRTLSLSADAGGRAGPSHPETQAIAFPATPRLAKDPETPGCSSTPGICSPPVPCHRGTKGGGKRRVSSRLRTVVGLHDASSDPLNADGDGASGCRECLAGAGEGGSGGSPRCCGSGACLERSGKYGTRGSDGAFDGRSSGRLAHPRRQGRSNELCTSFGGGDGGGGGSGCDSPSAAGAGVAATGPYPANDPMAAGAGAAGRPRRRSSSNSCSNGCACGDPHSACLRRDLPKCNEQLLDSSSVERFSDQRDGAASTPDGPGWVWDSGAWGGFGCRRGRAVNRRRRRPRRRGARRPLEERGEEESLFDFRGRMAAVASATRLCLVSSSSTTTATGTAAPPRATAGTTNAFVMGTPPHPTASATADPPVLPRRRLLAAASPGLPPSSPAAAVAAAAATKENGFFTWANRRDARRSSVSPRATGSGLTDDASSNCDKNGVDGWSWPPMRSSACSTPARGGEAAGAPGTAEAAAVPEAPGIGPGTPAAAATAADEKSEMSGGRGPLSMGGDGRRPGGGGRGQRRGRSSPAVDPSLAALKPSQRTAPRTRAWPDFENLRYHPPESLISTPLRRSDWTVPHGSAMRALKAALEEAALGTAASKQCSSPLDMREERRNSIRRRYLERAEHFKLIQTARENSAGKGSAMLAVMRQRQQAEEDERRATEQREARAAWLKERVLMRLMEGRRAAFLAWARRARACRKARDMLRSRESSRQRGVFEAWREDARRSRRIREFVVKYLSGWKRTTFTAWKESTRRSIAARNMALRHLQGAQKASFCTWRDTTRENVRRRELALERSAMVRSALDGLGGTRSRFFRWRAWAGKRAVAKRMGQRTRDAGLRRCLLALAENQLSLRRLLQKRRLITLAAAFAGWRVGLGRLLRARLLPVNGGAERIEMVGGDGGGGDSGGRGGGGGKNAGDSTRRSVVASRYREATVRSPLWMDGWDFAPREQRSVPAGAAELGPRRDPETTRGPKESGRVDRGGGGGSAERGAEGEAGAGGEGTREATSESATWSWKGKVDSPPLPPSAFFSATHTSRVVGAVVEAAAAAGIGDPAATGGGPAPGGERESSRGGSRRRGRRRRRKDGDGGRRGKETP